MAFDSLDSISRRLKELGSFAAVGPEELSTMISGGGSFIGSCLSDLVYCRYWAVWCHDAGRGLPQLIPSSLGGRVSLPQSWVRSPGSDIEPPRPTPHVQLRGVHESGNEAFAALAVRETRA
jgi:hypothetical protein